MVSTLLRRSFKLLWTFIYIHFEDLKEVKNDLEKTYHLRNASTITISIHYRKPKYLDMSIGIEALGICVPRPNIIQSSSFKFLRITIVERHDVIFRSAFRVRLIKTGVIDKTN